ncbi:MAG: DUF1150 family protein [Hyphomonas sp.]
MLNDENTARFEADPIVYIRHLGADEVNELVPANALEGVGHPEDLFMVASADGRQLAIVEGREAAFAAARMHDLTPVSVH